MLRQIKSSLWNPRIIPLKCTGLDSPVLDVPTNIATVSRSGAGVYVITVKSEFAIDRILGFTAPITAGKTVVMNTAASRTTVTINSFTASSGAAADAEFYLFLVSQDSTNVTHIKRPSGFLYSHHPRCRLLGLAVDDDATILSGARDFTVSRDGSDIFTVTLKKPGKVAPLAVGGGFGVVGNGSKAVITATTINTMTLVVQGIAGTTIAAAGFSLLVFVYDSVADIQSPGRRHPVLSSQVEPVFGAVSFLQADSGLTVTDIYGGFLSTTKTNLATGIGRLRLLGADTAHQGYLGRTPVAIAQAVGAVESDCRIWKTNTDYRTIRWLAEDGAGSYLDCENNIAWLGYGSVSET